MYIEIRHEISNNTGAVTMLLRFSICALQWPLRDVLRVPLMFSTDLVHVFKCYVFYHGLI